MPRLIPTVLAIACAGFTAPTLHAAEAEALAYARAQLAALGETPDITSVVKAGNLRHGALDEAQILDLDAAWRAEIGSTSDTVIAPVLESDASDALREIVEAANGRIVEIIVMDKMGMNAAISAITSDYWQGDEAKYLETYPKGAGAVFVDTVEFDESSNLYLQQVSGTLTDPATGMPIGAVTFGLDASAFN